MKKIFTLVFTLLIILSSLGLSLAAEPDVKGGQDHPLLSRMPGFHITEYKENEFQSFTFITQGNKKNPVEGRYYHLQYNLDKGEKEPGELKIRRNVQEALKKIGGKVLFDDNFNRASTIMVQKDGKETWVEVRSYNAMYRLTIVEKQSMEQEMVANAEALGNGINATGHAAVYGIYFDTGSSVIKPESEAAISEIAKLLQKDAALKLYVVGHTDNVGTLSSNTKLSQDRAASVVTALTGKHGIAAGRLNPQGVASLCPVASNDTEEGKAKNRRVELVKQ